MSAHLHLAVALDGAGWHPAAWRESSARPAELFDARYWVDLVRTAERGAVDFVTFEDALTLQSAHPFRPDDRVDQVRGRLDAALLATRVAPTTSNIGLIPTMTTTHTEPFHVSTKVASLDFVSRGRAGWRVQILRQRAELAHFGRRELPERVTDRRHRSADAATRLLFDEAADAVEVARRLWDSWEDDAEIRDRATGRFIDRDKLHYVDFEGEFFSVRGPSITPRPPQGQPLVTVLAQSRSPTSSPHAAPMSCSSRPTMSKRSPRSPARYAMPRLASGGPGRPLLHVRRSRRLPRGRSDRGRGGEGPARRSSTACPSIRRRDLGDQPGGIGRSARRLARGRHRRIPAPARPFPR